jgi:chromatin modification-related protein VID21
VTTSSPSLAASSSTLREPTSTPPNSIKQQTASRAPSPPPLPPALPAETQETSKVEAITNGLEEHPKKAPAANATPSLPEAAVSPSATNKAAQDSSQEQSVPPAQPAQRRAKVIHLPSQEEQEKHLREIQIAQEGARQRERREDESIGLSVSVPGHDAVSSPSSTAGAYSTSTPKPPQHSPDTSPDAEYSPARQSHLQETNFEQGMSQVTKNGRPIDMLSPPDTNATPEAQLQLEAEQAGSSTRFGERSTSPLRADGESARTTAHSDVAMEDITTTTTIPTKKESIEPSSTWKVPSRPSGSTDAEMRDDPLIIHRKSNPNGKGNAPAPEEPTRRLTRVASGAIRQKSVSEILGETPRQQSAHVSRRSSQAGPLSAAFSMRESLVTPNEDRDKSKHSMVVFTKKEKTASPIRTSRYEPDGYLALKGASEDPEKDYLRPLFLHQAYVPPRATAFENLIQGAHKTLTTDNIYANVRESIDYRILRRIYQLQNANKWSLRQMAKFPDPLPPVTHQDHLLAEMKWMRTDFREERKWKAAAARRLAEVCSIYVAAPEEVRVHMRTKAKIPPKDVLPDAIEATPELEPTAIDSGGSLPDEDVPETPPFDTVAPAALFSLGFDDVVFQLDPTPTGEGILNELPLYESKPIEPLPYFIAADTQRNQILPVSKFATGKLVPKPSGPPRKRSRFDYESDEDETVTGFQPRKRSSSEVSLFLSPARRSPRNRELAPEETDVALFNPINRHIRDRLRANTAFRPPWEFSMPTTNFFENRIPSQWTWDEDQKLRTCVKKFSYNWSLIAMELQAFTQPSIFVAASERRTPWECFERWYQLEGLPNDMDKTAYFRTYRQRIEAANRIVAAQAAQQMQQQGANPQYRRRPSTQPYRVERRRDTRHMTMVDNIRKQARKRETALHRQAESAKASALRKQHSEANQARNSGIHTPQEFSRMKHERELKMQERQEIYRQQLMQQQQQRTAAMQRSQMPGGQQPPMPNGAGPQQRVSTPNGSQGPSPPAQLPNGQPGANVPQQRPPSQGMMQAGFNNGSMNSMGALNIPQAQMQAMQSQQQRMNPQGSNENLHRMMVQQQAQRQYQTQMQNGNGLAVAHLGNAIQNPQMIAAMQAAQRAKNGTQNGFAGPSMAAASPRTHPSHNQLPQQAQQLSSGHTPAFIMLQQQVQTQFPHFTDAQVRALAQERLQGQVQLKQMQASALSAASGSPAPMGNLTPMQQMGYTSSGNGMNGMPGPHSPTQYQQQLHRSMQQQQQQQQQAAAARLGSGSPGMSNVGLAGSRSATPNGQPGGLMMQRTASGNAMGEDGSPRLMQAQMARP